MYDPGYYKTNYRGLRFREVLRMQGLPQAFTAYLKTRFMRPVSGGWMPGLWADTECKREDLSEAFLRAAKPHRQDFERLGFTECGFVRSTRNLNPLIRDSCGITYLDPTRCHFGQLLYHRLYAPIERREIHQIVIAFTAAFEHGCLSITNHNQAFDPPKENEVIRLPSYDVAFLHQQFLRGLQQRKEIPRQFPDLESLRQWFDAGQVKVFEERARRRLFIPMTDQEVATAKAKLQGANAETTTPPRSNFRWAVWFVIIALIFLLQLIRNHLH